MANYRMTERGAWVEVDDRENVIRVIEEPDARPDEIQPYRVQPEIIPYSEPVSPGQLPASASQRVEIRSSYADRAKGFNNKVRIPALLTGLVAGVVAWHFGSVPLLSGAMLLILVGGFSLVWLAAYIVHEAVSPDGVSLIHTLLGFCLLYRQQSQQLRQSQERHSFLMEQQRQSAQDQRDGRSLPVYTEVNREADEK